MTFWLILGWCLIGWYEWWRMIRQARWIAWPHLALVLVYVLMGPIIMIVIRIDEWLDSQS